MVVLTLSWGLNGVAAKLSYPGYSPIFVSIARAVDRRRSRAGLVPLSRHNPFSRDGTLWLGLLAGGSCSACEFVLIFVGLEFTSVARSTLMVNTMPFWVLIGAHFLLGERMIAYQVRRAGAGLLRRGAGVFRQAQPHRPVDADRRPDVARRRHLAGRRRRWSSRRSSLRIDQRREAAALPARHVDPAWRCRCSFFTGPAIREPTRLRPSWRSLFQAIYIVGITYMLWFWLMRRYPATGLSSLRVPDAGVRRAVRRLHPWRTAEHAYIHGAGADCGRLVHRQPAPRATPS